MKRLLLTSLLPVLGLIAIFSIGFFTGYERGRKFEKYVCKTNKEFDSHIKLQLTCPEGRTCGLNYEGCPKERTCEEHAGMVTAWMWIYDDPKEKP